MWTEFYDMHSGGDTKVIIDKQPKERIYVELPETEARIWFYNRFGHNCDRVSCTCCGNDYWVSTDESLAQLTAYQRGCHHYDKVNKRYSEKDAKTSLADYLLQANILVVDRKDVLPGETEGTVPKQGYVWVD